MATPAQMQLPPVASALERLRRSNWTSLLGLALLGLVVAWLIVNFVQDPGQFVTVTLIGITLGAVYGLVALGYTLVYGILELINFAHGDVFALLGLFASTLILSVFTLTAESGLGAILGGLIAIALIGMVLGAVLNSGIERLAYRPLRSAPKFAVLITAVGMSFIVQNVSLAIWGVNARAVPKLISEAKIFTIAGISYEWDKLFVLLVTVPVLLALVWLVNSTRQGKAMRATAQDREAAAMMGIDVNRTISFTFALAGALASMGGLLFLLQFNMRYDTGFQLGLTAFTAAVLGGIGNLPGAVLGAILIGLIQAYNEGLSWHEPGGAWTRSIVFGILIAILVFRPQGLLGEKPSYRA